MVKRYGNILVAGGHSRIAASLAPLLGDHARFVVRRPARSSRETPVDDYSEIPLSLFEGTDCVINCVGVSSGDRELMRRINVDMPLALARQAKAAGVGRLIHISSFSVYGGARLIDARTPEAPAGDYGRSKLAADTCLLALADSGFAVTALRLPLIYGEDSLGKLGRLLKLWARLRIFPVPAADISRAMISTDLCAEIIARLSTEPRAGVLFAADPEPFTYARAAAARPETLARLPLPSPVTRMAQIIAPVMATQLFADSRLADAVNLAIDYNLPSRLYHDIATADLDRP